MYLTGAFVFIFAIFLIIFSIPCFPVAFIAPPQSIEYEMCRKITVTAVVSFLGVQLLKSLVDFMYEMWKVNERGRKRIDAYITLIGVIILAIVPRCVVYSMEYEFNHAFFLTTSFFTLLSIFFFTFNSDFPSIVFNYLSIEVKILYLTGFHTITFLVSAMTAMGYENGEGTLIFFTHFSLSGILTAASIELLTLATGNYQFEQEDVPDEKPEIQPEKYDGSRSLLEYFVYSASYLTSVTVFAGLLYLGCHPFEFDVWIVFGVISIMCLAIFGLVGLMKQLIQEDEMSMSVGYGAMAICGIAAKVAVLFVGDDLFLLLPIFLISQFAFFNFYYRMVYGYREMYYLIYNKNELGVIFTFVACVAMSIIIGRAQEGPVFVFCEFIFLTMSTLSSICFVMVWKDGLGAYEKSENEDVPKIVVEVPDEETVKIPKIPKITCPTCQIHYSHTKTPRILKECGHTMCEDCADTLLDQNQYLTCPMCEQITVVKGPARLLAKNYLALDLCY